MIIITISIHKDKEGRLLHPINAASKAELTQAGYRISEVTTNSTGTFYVLQPTQTLEEKVVFFEAKEKRRIERFNELKHAYDVSNSVAERLVVLAKFLDFE